MYTVNRGAEERSHVLTYSLKSLSSVLCWFRQYCAPFSHISPSLVVPHDLESCSLVASLRRTKGRHVNRGLNNGEARLVEIPRNIVLLIADTFERCHICLDQAIDTVWSNHVSAWQAYYRTSLLHTGTFSPEHFQPTLGLTLLFLHPSPSTTTPLSAAAFAILPSFPLVMWHCRFDLCSALPQ